MWWLWSLEGPLQERVMRGGLWLVADQVATRLTSLAKTAVLARQLAARDFGLMGMGLLVLNWLDQVSATGFNTALVRHPGSTRPYLDTAWTVQVLRGVLHAGIMILAAPSAGLLFGTPDAVPVIQSLGVLAFVRSLASPAFVNLRKELQFRRIAILNIASALMGLTVGVLAAVALRSVWALVLSFGAAQTVHVVGSYIVMPHWPRLRLDSARAKELFAFGRWVFALNLLNFLALNVDSLVVARSLGASELGIYQLAQQLALFITMPIQSVLFGVSLPAFAKLHEANAGTAQQTRSAFLRGLQVTLLIVLPLGSCISLFAGEAVALTLGAQWRNASAPLAALAWAGVGITITGISSSYFHAIGRPGLPVLGSVVRLSITCGLLLPAVAAGGIVGAALAATAGSLSAMLLQLLFAAAAVRPNWHELVDTVKGGVLGALPFLAGGCLMAFAPGATVPLLVIGVALAGYALIVARAVRPMRLAGAGSAAAGQGA